MHRPIPSLACLLLTLFGLGGCNSPGYHREGGQWHHGDIAFTPEDPATFKALDKRFARDAKRGYFLGASIAGSDGASFVVVSENEARDKGAVYWCDTYRNGQEYWSIRHLRVERVDGADPASYKSLGRGHARDAQRVYFEGRPFEVRDVAGFVPLDGDYGRDGLRAYHARREIAGSHGPSFEVVDERDTGYARDRQYGYYAVAGLDGDRARDVPGQGIVRVLRTADTATLRVLGRGYAADAQQVWYRGRLLPGADPATFASDAAYQGNVDATDRSGGWQQGRRLVAAP